MTTTISSDSQRQDSVQLIQRYQGGDALAMNELFRRYYEPVRRIVALRGDLPSTNFGATQTLEADASPLEHFLLKFEVTGVGSRAVTAVKVRLVNDNASSKGGNFRAAGNGWTETDVTLANATAGPAPVVDLSAPVLASLGAVTGTVKVQTSGGSSNSITFTLIQNAPFNPSTITWSGSSASRCSTAPSARSS